MGLNHQRGIALFTTLILLVVVTLTSVLLIRNAGFETKISGAYADRIVSEGEVAGAVDELIDSARNGVVNPFVDDELNYPQSATATEFPDVVNEIDFVIETPGSCQRSEKANSQNLNLVCRLLEMDSALSYSRSNAGQNDVATGLVHPLTQ